MGKNTAGCSDHSCKLRKKKSWGAGTNGGCMCLKTLNFHDRVAIEKSLHKLDNVNSVLDKLAGDSAPEEFDNAMDRIFDILGRKLPDE